MNKRAGVFAVAGVFVALTASGCAVTPEQRTVGVDVDDKTITSAIKARHAESGDVLTTGITVETLYGVVLLSGFADSPQEKKAARNIAEQVDGVKAVHNEILVLP